MTIRGCPARAVLALSCLLATVMFTREMHAQDTLDMRALIPVSVSATRSGARSVLELPFATTRVTPDSSRPGLRKLSVGELLLGVPGVQVQDRANPSQDPRLSIRGFGARSAFGVRGVRVIRDGLPLSLPDGQTPLDWLDLETVGTVEVIRGTAAALFGNAAGGVVSFRTRDVPIQPLAAQARSWSGAGLTRWSAQVSSASDNREGMLQQPSLLWSFTRTAGDGPRTWAQQEVTSMFARSAANVGGVRLELQGTHYDNPRAENTGALTADELARDPSLPDSLNVQKQSRKAVKHSQVALIASRETGATEWSASVFTSARDLDNPLPFSIVGVERTASGATARASTRITGLPSYLVALRLTAGGDAQWQNDERVNYENCADFAPGGAPTAACPSPGNERGALRLLQRELVRGIGAYARGELELPGQLLLSGAVRHDRVSFGVRDRFITAANADDSGDRDMTATSPMMGLVWRVRPLMSLYANWARAFETPTITELTNQPDGRAGLNAVIAPQRTRTIEVGSAALIGPYLCTDIALFDAVVTDELVSFDVPGAPGRRAFRNAGRTLRRGIETRLLATVARTEVGVAYTASHFRYVDYAVGSNNFAGNAIPGVPAQQAHLWATQRLGNAFATVESRLSSRISANDAATVHAPGFATWAVRGGYRVPLPFVDLDVIAGADNIFDRRFASSVVTNATRGRFYEPGLPRRVYVGGTIVTGFARQEIR